MNSTASDFFTIYFSIVKEIDFFSDFTTANYLENKEDQQLVEEINLLDLFVISIPVFFITFSALLKFFLVFLYFVVVSIMKSVYLFIKFVIYTKCGCRCKVVSKRAYHFGKDVLKKLYKYNFYSFGSYWINGLLSSIYVTFLISNLVFVIKTFNFFKNIKEGDHFDYPLSLVIARIVALQTHIFIEIFTNVIYFVKSFNRSVVYSFLGGAFINLVLLIPTFLFIALPYNIDEELDYLKLIVINRFMYLITLGCILWIQVKAWLQIHRYKKYEANLKSYKEGREKFFMDNNFMMELADKKSGFSFNEIVNTKVMKLERVYDDIQNRDFFKKRSRFYYRKILNVTHFLGIVLSVYSIIFVLYQNAVGIYCINNNITDIKKVAGTSIIQHISRILLAVHPIHLVCHTWIVFMKLEIRTFILY